MRRTHHRGDFFVSGRRFDYKRGLITVWLGAGRKPWRGLLLNPRPFGADIWHCSRDDARLLVRRWAKELGAPQEVLDVLRCRS